VLQVVTATTASSTTITAATYEDTGITADITPSSATSKILVLISANALNTGVSVAYLGSGARIMRGATAVLTNGTAQQLETASANPISLMTQQGFTYLDSPATTSATTYKLQAKLNAGTNIHYNITGTSTITLLEIGA
jgi:uncharacterized protein YabE (DUF348 family)